MEQLDQIKEQVLHYARGIWINRWIAIGVTWVVLIIGVIGVDQIKDRYTAVTKVYIDTSSVLKPLLRGLAIQSDFDATVRLMVKQLLSRPNLERAARTMDLDLDVNGPGEMEMLINNIRNRVNISAARRGSYIYTITYTDTNRRKARQMVKTLLDIFVEDTLGKTVNQSDSAIDFINQQIEKYEGLLLEAEKRREDFRRKNIGLMPRDGYDYYAQLQNAESLLEKTELNLSELKNRRNKIKAQIIELKSGDVRPQATVKTSLDERIESHEKQLDDLLLLYTEEHPDVINAQHVLDSLRERKGKEAEQSVVSKSILDNPVFQQLQISLSKTEVDISSVNTRVLSLNKKRQELRNLVDIVPKIEAELSRLNRDYEIHRDNYNTLVSRREQAVMSEEAESDSEQVKFRIIEPPFVPQLPDYPNRALFDLGVLVLAIGFGYTIALLISLLQPVFYSQKDLMKYIGGAVLGSVNKFDTPNVLNGRRKSLVLYGLANTLLFCAAGSIIYFHSQGMLILSQLQTLVM